VPFRLDDFRARAQFVTFAEMPSMVYEACQATDTPSLTRYYQEAVCEKLARDLHTPLDDLLAMLPEPRTSAKVLLKPRNGPFQTVETVR
jgi:hypothetical protein